MAATTEVSIWLALKARIETLAAELDLPVAYPASTHSPHGREYLAVGRATAAPQRFSVGRGPHERNGSLIISYVAPLGQDAAVYEQVAGRIAAHFPEDTKMTHADVSVRVTAWPDVQAGYRDGAYWRVPVVIPVQAFE